MIQQYEHDHGGNYGTVVALDADTMAVGQHSSDEGGTDRGRVYVRLRTAPGIWGLQQEVVPDVPENSSNFGYSLALIGDTLLVGAPYKDNGGSNRGSVFVFTRTAGVWTQQQELAGTTDGLRLGYSMDTDGTKVVVGAPQNNPSGKGYVYVYSESLGVWSEDQNFQHSAPSGSDDEFGFDVAIDGDYIIAGAINYDWPNGRAYVFFYSGGTWTQQQVLQSHSSTQFFGAKVAIRGSTIAIHDRRPLSWGKVEVWTRVATTWTRKAYWWEPDGVSDRSFGNNLVFGDSELELYAAASGVNNSPTIGGCIYKFTATDSTWASYDYDYRRQWDPVDRQQANGFGAGLAYDPATEFLAVGVPNAQGGSWGGHQINESFFGVINQAPANGSTGNEPDCTIYAEIINTEGDADFIATSVKFWIDNTLAWISAAPVIGWIGERGSVTYGFSYSFAPSPDMPLAAGWHTVRVYAEDDVAGVIDETWVFSVSAAAVQALDYVDPADSAGELDTGLDLKLTTDTHDVVVEEYDLALVAGVDEVAQHLEVGLKMFYGEWFLDDEAGMPYYREVFIAAPKSRIVEAIFRQEILSDGDIEKIESFAMEIDKATRKLDVGFEAISSVGVVNVSSVFP